ncbi:MAG TPA: M13 family metallopeptidase, partial [Polyangiaceae bacterium]|nr:M13 family metallopeptidase [Polyangiaceae bacterium]
AYLDNVLAARADERRRSWARVNAARTRESWEMTVYPNDAEGMAAARLTIVNGFPDLPSNSIILPAASLRPPLFDAASPPEVRYGAFGSLVAHELVHALEHYAYEGDRARRPLWSPGDFAAHKARHRCVTEQASGFVAAESARLDGERTLDENVADLGGVTYAYRAMARELGRRVDERGADGLTAAQRFFVSYAQGWCEKARPEFARDSLRTDPHAPARFRVNGPLANVPEFAAAFSCPAKANMVRPAEQRCSVW